MFSYGNFRLIVFNDSITFITICAVDYAQINKTINTNTYSFKNTDLIQHYFFHSITFIFNLRSINSISAKIIKFLFFNN